jgi:hypothetical protein
VSKKTGTIWRKKETMQTEELKYLARKIRDSLPKVEAFPLSTICTTVKEQEKQNLIYQTIREIIYHLTSWDKSF